MTRIRVGTVALFAICVGALAVAARVPFVGATRITNPHAAAGAGCPETSLDQIAKAAGFPVLVPDVALASMANVTDSEWCANGEVRTTFASGINILQDPTEGNWPDPGGVWSRIAAQDSTGASTTGSVRGAPVASYRSRERRLRGYTRWH